MAGYSQQPTLRFKDKTLLRRTILVLAFPVILPLSWAMEIWDGMKMGINQARLNFKRDIDLCKRVWRGDDPRDI